MDIKEVRWIWQQPTWPEFQWKIKEVQPLLDHVHFKQGVLLGKASGTGTSLEATIDNMVENIMTSSAIESEHPNPASLRSSLMKRLGVPSTKITGISSRSEGLAQMMLDAVQNINDELTLERLLQWHQWLFPSDLFSLNPIEAGKLRGDEPMQVVSGRIDKPKVHFEAPPRDILEKELQVFIDWFNQTHHDSALDPFIRAAICHLWFVVIHPFEDGNGRIGRALTDLALAQANAASINLYAMSTTILKRRTEYYRVLEKSTKIDITPWIVWFLTSLDESLQHAIDKIDRMLIKLRFWQVHQNTDLSSEQRKVLNRLLDGGENGFEQGISASQYQTVAKVSKPTATRHLTDLLAKKCIVKLPGGGRNSRYRINSETS